MRWVPNSRLTTIKEIRAEPAKKHRVQFEKVFFVRSV